MTGVPATRTFIETVLFWLGSIGAVIGFLLSAAGCLGTFLAFVGVGSPAFMYMLFPLFSIGAFGCVVGLLMAALSQFLGSIRVIAHNSENSKDSV